jgi:hypothetical protein
MTTATTKHNVSVSYGNAEVRGQLRQWKKKLAQSYTIFNNAFKELQDGKLTPLVIDMVKCSRAGRERAFERISKALGPGVTLESASLGKGNSSLAIWSILKPRDAVTVVAGDDRSERERWSLAQDCVTVDYVLIGCVDSMILTGSGLWTLEVPDHALGRAVERSRFLHPGAIIREAHLNLLDLPATVLNRTNFTNNNSSGAYIKAGPGCFAGHFRLGEDASIENRLGAHVRVKTWLDADQLFERQIVLCEKAAPGKRLGDGWLRPSPLRRIEQSGPDTMQVRVWQLPHNNKRKKERPT